MAKKIFYRVYLLFLVTFFLSIVVANIETVVNVPDAPPYLDKVIPNQSLFLNTPKIDAFNLNDYFKENNGNNLTFSYLEAENILIDISENGSVSFYPGLGYMGVSNTTFYASDSKDTAESNVVYIFVNQDNIPPRWYNPRINRNTVYQSSYVNFSAFWTDNYQLSHFIFSINQGAGWVNSSGVVFSGTENLSIQREQISAEPGVPIYWRIYAYDVSGNINATDIQSFVVSDFNETESEGTTGAAITPTTATSAELFIDPSYFKISLKQGTSITKVLKIRNTGSSKIHVNLSKEGLDSFLTFSDNLVSFQLSPGETKEVLLDFRADERAIPEQYLGRIVVSSLKRTTVPVVIEVNEFEQQLGINITLPKKIKAGGPVNGTIKLSNLKDIRQTETNVYYSIKDFDGNVLDFNETKVVFNDSVTFNGILNMPSEVKEGRFIYYVRAYNNESLIVGSEIFELGNRFDIAAFLKLNFTLIILLFGSILIVFLAVRYKRYKDREKTLSLYLMLNQLKTFIQEDKLDSALEVYIRIKNMYNEPVSRDILKDKDLLKEELKSLAGKLKEKEKQIPKQETEKLVEKEVKDVESPKEELKENSEKKEVALQEDKNVETKIEKTPEEKSENPKN